MDKRKNDFMSRWYQEVWNNQNETAIDEMMHPNAAAHGLADGKIVGTDNFKQFYRDFNENFKEIHVSIDKEFIDGDFFTALVSVNVTNRRTGNTAQFTGSTTAQLENGIMINAWNHFDFLSMYIQLGNIKAEDLA